MTHLISQRSARVSNKRASPAALLVTTLGLAGLAAGCSAPVQAPHQRPSQTAAQSLVEELRDLVPRQSFPNAGVPVDSDLAPWAAPLPVVHWLALGAGDFAPVAAGLPTVNWPALGAGDYVADQAARFPKINWPALGAGDFEPTK